MFYFCLQFEVMFQFLMAGQAQQQESEDVDHIAPAGWKQRMVSAIALLIYTVDSALDHIQECLPMLVNLST